MAAENEAQRGGTGNEAQVDREAPTPGNRRVSLSSVRDFFAGYPIYGNNRVDILVPPDATFAPGIREFYVSYGGEGQEKQLTFHYAIKGLLFLVVGVIAISFPFIFGLAIEMLLGWILLLGGAVTLIQYCMVRENPGSNCFLLLGILHFGVGMWLVLKPLEGLTTLTVVLSGWFLGHGFLKLFMAWQVRRLNFWPLLVLSGFLSLGLGFSIVYLTPTYGLKLVGIIFGADIAATGISVLAISIVATFRRRRLVAAPSRTLGEPLLADAAA